MGRIKLGSGLRKAHPAPKCCLEQGGGDAGKGRNLPGGLGMEPVGMEFRSPGWLKVRAGGGGNPS